MNESECREIYEPLNKEYCRQDVLRELDYRIDNKELKPDILRDEELINDLTEVYIDNLDEGTMSRQTAINEALNYLEDEVMEYELDLDLDERD